MFNTVVLDNSHRSPSHITVHETKAPTDESVKLLMEMEEAAKSNILKAFSFQDNAFIKGLVIVHRNPRDPFKYTVFVKFKLNDKEFRVEKVIDACDIDTINQREGFRYLMESMAQAITEKFALDFYREAFPQK